MTSTMTRIAAASAGSVLALALAACGDNDGNNRDGAPAAEQSTSAPANPTASASDDSTGGSGRLVAAGSLVVSTVSGSTLTSIEDDNGGWEVTVAGDDGSSTDASTNAEGTQITRDPRKEDDDDASDLAERKREVAGASLDFEKAAAAITKAVPGSIRELNLDTRDDSDQVVWEADVRDSSGNQTSVTIDAKTGSVVSKTSDNDND